ncbi:folate/biopterin transporter [Nitzschia inconspicua]|uniref:Folate/biopterin transporter n=1 Tax=Nitzschia inconspicua TaxID=303405 RepID=A0A9K3M118_9STRA|nr:folate/biopterin transporter [Nitzschia inconspicua]
MTISDKVEFQEDLRLPNGGVLPKSDAFTDSADSSEFYDDHLVDSKELEMRPLNMDSLKGDGDEDDSTRKEKLLASTPELEESDGIFITSKPWNLEDWLYPPHLPRECQLLRPENIAIPACYLLVGILQGLSGPLINVYPLDLNATEAQQVTLSSIRSLPASFKLIFGFISDNFPIFGFRRKSFMLLGWGLAALSMSALILTTNLTLSEEEYEKEDGSMGTQTVAPENAPSVQFLSLTLLLFGTGFWMADVMGDSLVAEKAKLEPIHARGATQSSCYSYRFFGLMVASPFSTLLYSWAGPFYVISLLALLPLSTLPLVYMLGEVQHGEVASTRQQCREIWNTVCSRAVWQPLAFVYLYNVLQVGNSAWKQFLKTTLGFTNVQLNLIQNAACVLLYLGVICYKYFLIDWSWRLVYVVTTLLNGVFSILQVLLIVGITFGLSNFWFALGDDAFAEFIGGIQFLPTTIMMVHLCPHGSEGASYAMFTTVNNSALNLSAAFSTLLLGIWDVSKEALANHELQGMVNLTMLTTCMQVAGILFVGLLPRTKEELFQLREKAHGSSAIGGTIFLAITFMSIIYSITVGVLNIVAPGWSGES